jgi:nitronate monooxygenase
MLASLFGAMLAGVDYVLMGAGVPRAIPGVLDALARGEETRLKIDVADAQAGEEFACTFNPREFCGESLPAVKRPYFLAIVSSATLATALARKSSGKIDGFVVEGSTAGGHNAPPRGSAPLSERGEPLYGPQDIPDLPRIAALGLPFWLAGAYADPAKITEALSTGAAGVQVGTIFAFCEESGLAPDVKRRVLERVQAGEARIFTDPVASPTGFPFKVVELDGTLSQPEVYEARERKCDLGYLRSSYRRPDGTIGYRCAGEPVEHFVKKGGTAEQAQNRKCLCNGLLSAVGLGQVLPGGNEEPPILTAGDDLLNLRRFLRPQCLSYTADDVLQYLRGQDVPQAV